MKASGEKRFIGTLAAFLPQRLKDARAALGLTQKEMAGNLIVSDRAYQGYEDGRSIPGGGVISGYVRLGINANWLLTGEGPMLLKDLEPPLAPAPMPQPINIEALAASLDAMRKLAKPGETPEATARKAARFYQYCLDEGLITPDGLGEGHLKAAS